MKATLTVILLVFAWVLLAGVPAFAQGKRTFYTISQLSQEGVQMTAMPLPDRPREIADTSYTIYKGASVDLRVYYVHGAQYHPTFNPNPTGVYLNGQEFVFYCAEEKSFRQHTSNFLDVKEFDYLGRRFLMMINFREDCHGIDCEYRCYNVFELTDPNNIVQFSFSSIYEGLETFGEFNNDGQIDYARVSAKEDLDEEGARDHFNITAFTFPKGEKEGRQLLNGDKQAYYLTVRGEEQATSFEVVQADWFFPVKDSTGQTAARTPYFPPYKKFDPFHKFLFNPEGLRVEKRQFSLVVDKFGDVDAAQRFAEEMQRDQYRDVFVLIDQYGGDIAFQVLIGNFRSKQQAVALQDNLRKKGYQPRLLDFDDTY